MRLRKNTDNSQCRYRQKLNGQYESIDIQYVEGNTSHIAGYCVTGNLLKIKYTQLVLTKYQTKQLTFF